jgi:hypothetical protein
VAVEHQCPAAWFADSAYDVWSSRERLVHLDTKSPVRENFCEKVRDVSLAGRAGNERRIP